MKSERKSKVESLMEEASAALAAGAYFDAERAASQALVLADQAGDYEMMARIIMPLQESRRQKRLAAIDTGRLIRLSKENPEGIVLQPGCYLIEPMMVAAHARDLRLRANEEKIPVLMVVREPASRDGRWPICMIGPRTIRTKVAPPPKAKNGEPTPTLDWVIAASEALGDEAISSVDPDAEPAERVKQLLEGLAACPDHEKLHQALESACRAAARAGRAKVGGAV